MRQSGGSRLLWEVVATGACIVGTLLLINWLAGGVEIVSDTIMAGALLGVVLLATRVGRARVGWGPVALVTVVVGLVGGMLIGRLDGHIGAIFLAACIFGVLLGMVDSPRRPATHSRSAAAPAPVAPRPGIRRAELRQRARSR